jgi:hypothetical protein
LTIIVYARTTLSENWVSLGNLNFFDYLISSHQPKYIYIYIYIYIFILENLSGSHNTMWILELIGSRKNVKSTQHWFGPMQVQHRVYKRGLNGPSELSFHINSLNIYMSHIFYISWSAYFAENFAMEQLEMESIINWFIYFLQKLAEGNGS